jgi:hypothetical protein
MTNTLERRLFYIPSFKIYGSVAGFYDYGPPGCAIKQNLTQVSWAAAARCDDPGQQQQGVEPARNGSRSGNCCQRCLLQRLLLVPAVYAAEVAAEAAAVAASKGEQPLQWRV